MNMCKRVLAFGLLVLILMGTPVTAAETATPAAAAATPEPTAAPKETAAPADGSADAKAAAKSPPAPWFDDTALLGDSISDGLRLYAARKRKSDPNFLGKLQFLTVTAYNLRYAIAEKPKRLVRYGGRSMRPEEALQAMGARKAFILLGVNDIFRNAQESRERYAILIDNIKRENPDIKLCLIAMTPICKAGEKDAFTNANVDEFNAMLKALANATGCRYMDMNGQLRGEDGGLRKEYSNDDFVHLKGTAFEIYAANLDRMARDMS